MASKLFLVVFLFLALACLVAESSTSDVVWGLTRSTSGGLSSQTCNGLVGECIDEEEEMMMESDISRRSLFNSGRHLSYDILKKNRVPCGVRGKSYYGCTRATKVNPYRRGCSAITHCQRFIR
ncbi:Rapid ALkalinization Factor [Macleaya cordata]|uniref:Rapid ALkalinization Factor n=1 Tax=Macleaya cordata TaxID=56857 RepID=A0A200QWR5_MACCD|nr:Rapid ALkalinization Factor [Macleaya cordata]